jgi:hypothetical protein
VLINCNCTWQQLESFHWFGCISTSVLLLLLHCIHPVHTQGHPYAHDCRSCGKHLTGLVLHETCEVEGPSAAWPQLLSQLPQLRVVHLEGRNHINHQAPHLVAACGSAQRCLQLEVHTDQVTEEEGQGLAGGSQWVKVVRVKRFTLCEE